MLSSHDDKGSAFILFRIALQKNEGPLPTILNVLNFFQSKISSSTRDVAIKRSFDTILNATVNGLGPSDLCRVIKGGLLRCMPVWGPIICSICQTILTTLAEQIIIWSALTKTGESLQAMPLMDYSRLSIPWWSSFTNTVKQGLALKQRFDQEERRPRLSST